MNGGSCAFATAPRMKDGPTNIWPGWRKTDSRIRVVCPEDMIGAAALNRACASATGEYCVSLGREDSLSHAALNHMAEFLQRQTADLLYTDEDSVAALRGPSQPVFKPRLVTRPVVVGHVPGNGA